MTAGQALALVAAPVGAAFLMLAIPPLWIFDRVDLWRSQAIWFRDHPHASWLPRLLWAAFAVTALFSALVGVTR